MPNDDEYDIAPRIGAIQKNETTTVEVRKMVDTGNIDIREFVRSESYEGPTRKGINITADALSQLTAILTGGHGTGYVDAPVESAGDSITSSEEAELMGSIKLNETTTLQVHRVHYKGQDYFDIREFVESETYQGPTRKGIRLRDDLIRELLEVVA